MSLFLLTGIVLFAVPFLVICGFCIYIFLAFVRDDPDASNVARGAFSVMFFGLFLIIWHFVSKMI